MTLTNITSLQEATPNGVDLVSFSVGGIFKKTTVDNLKSGMSVATSETKGLMSAADKVTLTNLNTQVSAIVAPPSAPVVSAETIAIPSGRTHITLTGTTTIQAITGMTPRVRYTFSYPSGAGITFLGEPLSAGDVVEVIDD